MWRLSSSLVRRFTPWLISWSRLPERRVPTEPIPELVPDLGVEVLSDSNTPGEM